tara:strand:+ start:1597 stop:2910 length:1314 start_codon:yes stop_codon:yes gene_type:complete
MGGIVKKVKKIIKKPIKIIGKTIRKVAKKVKKIGKSVMKGVAKFTNKLGPIGMIAMSIAMPYALAGLSTATTAAYTSSNIFIKAVGTIGNQIRLGYQAFNTGMSLAKRGISDVITKTFQKFAPKGGTNMFSRISQGAKNLYTSAKNKLQSVTPKFRTAPGGSVDLTGQLPTGPASWNNTAINKTLTNDRAAELLGKNLIDGSQLTGQSLSGQGGWFTKTNATGVSSDRLVTDAINDAYKTRLEGFGPNAKRMYNDIRNKAMEMNTYINDEQIGSFVESNKAARTYSNEIMEYAGDMDYTGTSKIKNITEIADLGETGNYTLGTNRDRVAGTYDFNGNEAFGNQPTSESFFKKNSSKLKSLTKSILSPDKKPDEVPGYVAPSLDTSSISSFNSSYDGTNQEGSQGGSLVAKVYGDAAANKILKYHQNMNLLNSGEIYI